MQNIPYQDQEFAYSSLFKFIINNLPDYTEKLKKPREADSFLSVNGDDIDINKVVLFSNKSKVPPMYRALSAAYRDRLLFGFVTSEDTEVVERAKITSFPALIVYQTYDPRTGKPTVLEEYKYESDEYDFHKLSQFVERFARSPRPYKKSKEKT